MAWIKIIPFEEAKDSLRRIYKRVQGANGQIDQILLAHSLRPHTLAGHMSLYKSVLHHTGNTLPKWYLECIGVFVSMLNQCDYCVVHHQAGMKKLMDDNHKYELAMHALATDLKLFFDSKMRKGLLYAKSLTLDASKLTRDDFSLLLKEGFSEGEILEINQVTAYFNYANRTVLGLGVTTAGEELGLSPKGDGDGDWGHM